MSVEVAQWPCPYCPQSFGSRESVKGHLEVDRHILNLLRQLQYALTSTKCQASYECYEGTSEEQNDQSPPLRCPHPNCTNTLQYRKKNGLFRHFKKHISCDALCGCRANFTRLDLFEKHLQTCRTMQESSNNRPGGKPEYLETLGMKNHLNSVAMNELNRLLDLSSNIHKAKETDSRPSKRRHIQQNSSVEYRADIGLEVSSGPENCALQTHRTSGSTLDPDGLIPFPVESPQPSGQISVESGQAATLRCNTNVQERDLGFRLPTNTSPKFSAEDSAQNLLKNAHNYPNEEISNNVLPMVKPSSAGMQEYAQEGLRDGVQASVANQLPRLPYSHIESVSDGHGNIETRQNWPALMNLSSPGENNWFEFNDIASTNSNGWINNDWTMFFTDFNVSN